MTSLLRGLLAGLLVIGLIVLGSGPAGVAAQDKKVMTKEEKEKADKALKDELRDKSVGIATSDGLTLNGYWFQGGAIDKQRPDAVLMFPAPGSKINDAWIGLANELSKKNFSVLLFDWRGCGMNATDTSGSRIFEDKGKFWKEMYNMQLLKGSQKLVEDKGLDFKTLIGKSDSALRYRDFFINDLLGARFYLDKQNDNGKCNTNRVWVVTEKDGAQLALSFIAAEFTRNTIYQPKENRFDTVKQGKAAGKDYVGLTALSFGPGNGQFSATSNAIWKNALGTLNLDRAKEASDHFEHRLAMVMVYGKKDGSAASKSAFSQVRAGGTDDELKKNFKYLREVDNSKQVKAISGIDLIDPMDSFGAKAKIIEAMVEISRDKQNFGKDPTDREANKMTAPDRFPSDILGRRN